MIVVMPFSNGHNKVTFIKALLFAADIKYIHLNLINMIILLFPFNFHQSRIITLKENIYIYIKSL